MFAFSPCIFSSLDPVYSYFFPKWLFYLFIKGIGEAWLFRWDCWLIDILSDIFIYFESVCDCLTFKSEKPTLADLQKYVYWGELLQISWTYLKQVLGPEIKVAE